MDFLFVETNEIYKRNKTNKEIKNLVSVTLSLSGVQYVPIDSKNIKRSN